MFRVDPGVWRELRISRAIPPAIIRTGSEEPRRTANTSLSFEPTVSTSFVLGGEMHSNMPFDVYGVILTYNVQNLAETQSVSQVWEFDGAGISLGAFSFQPPAIGGGFLNIYMPLVMVRSTYGAPSGPFSGEYSLCPLRCAPYNAGTTVIISSEVSCTATPVTDHEFQQMYIKHFLSSRLKNNFHEISLIYY